jgi:hypothetical protein
MNDTEIYADSILSIIISLGIPLIFYVLNAFLLGKVFEKAGLEQWKAWVPIYSSWKFLELGGQKGWWILVAFIPFIGQIAATVFLCIAAYNIGISLGKSGAWVVLYIFLSIIWAGILAFDDSRWNGQQAKSYNY